METQPTGQQFNSSAHRGPSRRRWITLAILVLVLLVACIVVAVVLLGGKAATPMPTVRPITNSVQTPQSAVPEPQLENKVLVSGRDRVWDMAPIGVDQLLFTERKGTLSLLTLSTQKVTEVSKIADVFAGGEGGLMGLAVDPEFTTNRYIYTCYNTSTDIRVVRWKLPANQTSLIDKKPIVTGMPRNPSGRHSGCRVAFGPDKFLWVTTGDSAQNLTPQPSQNPKSLGGKILRVNRDGQAASGNLGAPFDSRIYSYGHRNVQGIAFFEKPIQGVVGVSAEHGSDVDDEVNQLRSGNFGWAPPDGPYNEAGVPMTDKQRFPNAIDAIWKSGDPTQAPSGIAVLKGTSWKAWQGRLLVAVLKDKHLKLLTIDQNLTMTAETRLYENAFGRVRSVVQHPSGVVFVSTDNGSGRDQIIQITPKP